MRYHYFVKGGLYKLVGVGVVRIHSFRDTAVAKGDAFLALFAINSLSSWYSLQALRDKIVRENENDESIPMVIIANKKVS